MKIILVVVLDKKPVPVKYINLPVPVLFYWTIKEETPWIWAILVD